MVSTNLQDIYTKIIDIVAEILTIDKATITPESTFEQLGADSLDMLEIVMKLEEAFDIEISDEQAAQITSIKQAAEKIYAAKNK